jgi:hypothetical protein
MTIPLDSASSSTSIGSLRNRFADQHLPHACFRRISPQRFWFRGLWRKPGQRFAVCGGNPAWQVHVSLLADMWPPWRLTHPELPGHKATLAKLAFVDLQQRLLSSIPAFLQLAVLRCLAASLRYRAFPQHGSLVGGHGRLGWQRYQLAASRIKLRTRGPVLPSTNARAAADEACPSSPSTSR